MMLAVLLAGQLASLPRINFSTSQFASQYGAIRAMQEAKETQASPGLRAASADLEALEKTFPSRIRTRSGAVIDASSGGQARVNDLYWRTLDALTFSAGSVDRLADISQVMPKIGGELDTTAAMTAIAKALSDSKSDFESNLWPKYQKEAKECVDAFEQISANKQEETLGFIARSAAITKTPKQIDILVVPRMAGKEGMTVRTPTGTMIIIGSGKYRGSDFAEVVFHEATHVLDTAAGANSLFGKLRLALKEAKRSDFELEQVPHVIMFLLAAEAVRRNIDTHHKDVGETFGAYARGLDPIRKIEAPVITDLVMQRISLDEAVRKIVAGLPTG